MRQRLEEGQPSNTKRTSIDNLWRRMLLHRWDPEHPELPWPTLWRLSHNSIPRPILPFKDEVMNIELQANWDRLNIDWYHGTTNPDENVDLHMTLTMQYFVVFSPTSLKAVELSWFTRIPPVFYRLFLKFGEQVHNTICNKYTTPYDLSGTCQ